MTTDVPLARQADEEGQRRLPDEAVVTRGGLSTAETLSMTAFAHYDLHEVFAISVRSAVDMTADELASVDPPFPHPVLRETTVGNLRQAGFEVIPDEPPPKHALIMLDLFPADDDYLRITAILGAPRPNPAYTQEENG